MYTHGKTTRNVQREQCKHTENNQKKLEMFREQCIHTGKQPEMFREQCIHTGKQPEMFREQCIHTGKQPEMFREQCIHTGKTTRNVQRLMYTHRETTRNVQRTIWLHFISFLDCTWTVQVYTRESAALAIEQKQHLKDFPWILADERETTLEDAKMIPLKAVNSDYLQMQLYAEESSIK
ncbi:MAD2L2 [Mytilus edulis]|uniref:MAD2L2 n=1 Tax=Mytilus edulis TaxID=6550 RepID=A0A8S3U9P8_MYTED|nr:MAD2L2 [Mytilus edulis]